MSPEKTTPTYSPSTTSSHAGRNETRLGTLLVLAPMAIYGILHFAYAGFVANLVPAWIP
jgi:hypothetical protein